MILRLGSYLQDRYEIIELIGSGGMAEVYRAFCHKMQRTVAIKVLKEEYNDNADFIKRFTQEALAAAQLSHPNLVNVYEVEHTDGFYYIVMEFVDGITLKEYIHQKGKLEQREAVGIAIQVANGLAEVHRRGIVHRDVKPQNMIISSDGKVKLADFGIARMVSTETMSQEAMGSVHYISPEHAQGKATDARSDLYSLGICLYEMVTGTVPFDGAEAVTILLAQLNQNPPSPRSLNPEISLSLERIILKSLEKDPRARYQSAAELIRDLETAVQNPTALPPSMQAAAAVGGDTIRFNAKDFAGQQTLLAEDSFPEPDTAETEERGEDDENNSADRRLNKLIKAVGTALLILLLGGGVAAGLILSGSLRERDGKNESESAETEQSSALNDKQAYAPYLIGLSSKEAEEALKEEDLTLVIQLRKNSDQFPKDTVIEQEPKPGSVVQKNSKVYVTLSLGVAEFELSELNLVGAEEESAKKTLTEKGFSVEEKSEYSDTVEKGKVVRLSPEKVKKGETVTVVLSLGKEPEKTKMPDLTYNTEESAKQALTEAGLQLGTVTKEHSDTVPQGQVIRQSISSGTETEKGKTVDLVLSDGPKVTSVESTQASESSSRYVASIDTNFTLSNLIGPDSGATSVTVMVRLRQDVNGQTVYRTLMEPRTIRGDAILPLRFRTIEGAYGVDMGYVEIVRTDNGQVLQSFDVQFFKVQ